MNPLHSCYKPISVIPSSFQCFYNYCNKPAFLDLKLVLLIGDRITPSPPSAITCIKPPGLGFISPFLNVTNFYEVTPALTH